jgi:hypothetical protein
MFPKIVIVQRPPTADKILKNIKFGAAMGITDTAKQGQAAVVGALRGAFTLRGLWFEQGNRFGIKIKPAKVNDMTAEVRTRADWLALHETGGTKKAQGGRLAIPTENVRRNKKLIIPRGQRPAALRGKRTFVVRTAHGDVLYQRKYKGKRSSIVALYNLEQSARIKKASTFREPIEKVLSRRLNANVRAGINKALASMK